MAKCFRSLVYEHDYSLPEVDSPIEDPVLIHAVHAHVEKYLGRIATTLHELHSHYVHVDVHVVAPGPSRDFYTLVTSGMSAAPMRAQVGEESALVYAELMLCLPPDWPIDLCNGKMLTRDATVVWPIELLVELARMPHEFDTWLAAGHTVSLERERVGFTRFRSALMLPPAAEPPAFWKLPVVATGSPEREVNFLSVLLLDARETRFKLEHGLEELLVRLQDAQVSDLLEPYRPCAVRRRLEACG